MVSIASLWLPILLSAVIVFVASFILHMVLPFHRHDFRQLAREDEVMNALRAFDIAPGDYLVPCATGPQSMHDPAFHERTKRGPVFVATFMDPARRTSLAGNLAMWFVYSIVVGVFAAYIAGEALPAGTPYPRVFQFAGCTAFIAYAVALWQNSIWYSKSWGTTLRSTVDGLIYGLLTAGVFGWLWPR
jgi:hypothetical protein